MTNTRTSVRADQIARMTLPEKASPSRGRGRAPAIVVAAPAVMREDSWLSAGSERTALARLGIKAEGGGVHQSKTMMLADLSALLSGGHGDEPGNAVLADNLLGKPSARARAAALLRLRQLYGIGSDAPLCVALRRLWMRDPEARPVLALLCSLARDPLLRDGAAAVLDAPLGVTVRWPAVAAAFEECNPRRLSDAMAKSMAQNAASSWTQAGFLKGAVRKERVRARATPVAAAYSALLANVCGFGGARLLTSRWLDVLDRPVEDRLSLLRQAEGLGLARVRSAGEVLEIDIRHPLGNALGVPGLVND